MKKLIFPTAAQMNASGGDFKSIVAAVLNMAPDIDVSRSHTVNTPSIIRAEFTRELEELEKLRGKMNSNIRDANSKQQ